MRDIFKIFLLITCLFFFPGLLSSEDFSSISSLISGSYLGDVGKTPVTIPLARFTCKGENIQGFMLIDHPDFYIKQYFRGKIIYSASDGKEKFFREVRISLIGEESEIAYLSPEFQKRINEIFSENKDMHARPEDIFIRQFYLCSFVWDAETDSVTFRAKLGYGSFAPQFPLIYYPVTGNVLLTKVKGKRTFEDLRRFKDRLGFPVVR